MADVTVTDDVLDQAAQIIATSMVDEPFEETAKRVADLILAHAPLSEREVELEAAHDATCNMLATASAERDQLAAYADGLREALEIITKTPPIDVWNGDSDLYSQGMNEGRKYCAGIAGQALETTPPQSLAARDGEVLALREALKETCTSLVIASDNARDAAKTDSRWEGVDEKLLRYAREGQAALTNSKQAAKDAEDRILEKAAKPNMFWDMDDPEQPTEPEEWWESQINWHWGDDLPTEPVSADFSTALRCDDVYCLFIPPQDGDPDSPPTVKEFASRIERDEAAQAIRARTKGS